MDTINVTDDSIFHRPKSKKPVKKEQKSRKKKGENDFLYGDLQLVFPMALDFDSSEEKSSKDIWDELARIITDRVTSILTRIGAASSNKTKGKFGLKADMLIHPIEICNVETGEMEDYDHLEHSSQRLVTILENNMPVKPVLTVLNAASVLDFDSISEAVRRDNNEWFMVEAERPQSSEETFRVLSDLSNRVQMLKPPSKSKSKVKTQPERLVAVFVMWKAELLSQSHLQHLVELLTAFSIPSVIVSCFRSTFGVTPLLSGVKLVNTTAESIGQTSDYHSTVQKFLETETKYNCLFGPKVSAYMFGLSAATHLADEMCNALKVCTATRFSENRLSVEAVIGMTGKEAGAEQLHTFCRRLPSFRQFVALQDPPVQIKILSGTSTGCGYFHEFVTARFRDLSKFRTTFLYLTNLLTNILSFAPVSWTVVYLTVVNGRSWKDCEELQKTGVGHEGKSLQLVERSLGSFVKPGNTISKVFASWKKDLSDYMADQKSDKDVLLKWRQNSRGGSPLIALLDTLCRRLPSFSSPVFHEFLFFDDVEQLRARLNPDIRHSNDLVLEDPLSALFSAAGVVSWEIIPNDLALVRASLHSDRRYLKMVKSLRAFRQKLHGDERHGDLAEKVGNEDLHQSSQEERARFMACLPALQALGILSLTVKARTSSYLVT